MISLRIAVLFVVVLLGSSDARAQYLCGSLGFTIVDSAGGRVAPYAGARIGSDSVTIASGMFALSLSSAGGALPLEIVTAGESRRFNLPTGGGYDFLLLEVTSDDLMMTVEIAHVEADRDYRLDGITFRPGVYALDLADARRIDRSHYGFQSVDRNLVLMRKLPRR